MTLFQKKVYEIVKTIPSGFVMTYSDIARILGSSHYCRAVGNALHNNPFAYTPSNLSSMDKKDLVPCHRVVNSKGELACHFGMDGGIESQKRLLESEGVAVNNYKVDLLLYNNDNIA